MNFQLLLTIICLVPTEITTEEVKYDGDQVLRVYPQTEEQVEKLLSIHGEYDFWTEPGKNLSTDIRVSSNKKNEFIEILDSKSIKYEILIKDLGALLKNNTRVTSLSRVNGNLDWKDYENFDSVWLSIILIIQQWLQQMATTHSDICELISIGKSYEKRELKVLWIRKKKGDNTKKRAMWLDGGIHAREWISPAIVTWIIKELLTKKTTYDDLLNRLDIYILPQINPDGYEYSRNRDRMWRKTRSINPGSPCVGVDPNRNFEFKFGGLGTSTSPCSQIYRGTKAFSEIELISMRDFILNRKEAKWKVYVTVHSYAQMILTPWGYERSVPDDYPALEKLGKEAAQAIKAVHGKEYRVGGAAVLLGPGAGGSDDWAKGAGGFKYSYTIETRDTGRHGFALPEKEIIPTCEEVFAAFIIFANQAAGKNCRKKA